MADNKSILLVLLLLVGCGAEDDPCRGSGGGGPRPETTFLVTHPHTDKVKPLYCAGETTPFEWDGKILAVTSTGKHDGFFIYDLLAAKQLSRIPVSGGDFSFVSAIVHDGVLYVYGTSGNISPGIARTNPGNTVRMTKTTDLVHWTNPVTVYQAAPDVAIHNTSIAKDADGFVLAMEIRRPGELLGHPRYALIFARGSLESFTDAGAMFEPYAACPSIRYVDGYYYVLYTSLQPVGWMVLVARSADLVNWQLSPSPYAALSPVNGADFEYDNGLQATNNSDPDLIEHDDKTYLVYLYGNQGTIAYLALAQFDGTLKEYFESFF